MSRCSESVFNIFVAGFVYGGKKLKIGQTILRITLLVSHY